MNLYVIDASVASRFLLTEGLSDETGLVLEGFVNGVIDLAAPRTIVHDVGNSLRKALSRIFFKAGRRQGEVFKFLELAIRIVELSKEDHEETSLWNMKNNMTHYDGTYLVTCQKVKGVPDGRQHFVREGKKGMC